MNRHRDGRVTSTEHTADGLRGLLADTLRFSPAFVDAWAASGALARSLEDRSGHDGPPLFGLPPSGREYPGRAI
jgi:hypothetical protein